MKIFGYTLEQFGWIGVRLSVGFTFLWGFLDKLFGLGYSTAPARSWLSGGSPTTGFLSHTSGLFSGLFQGLSGNAVVDVLFMLALLGIGAALILGIGQKITSYSGIVLMIILWASLVPSSTNPIIDEHIVFLFLFIAMLVVKPGQWFGLGKWWAETKLVKRFPILG
jgi:thiosulfate dehydrogenase (quinone) large subunit